MTSNSGAGNRLLGTLRSADGRGVVRMEDRYDTDIDDLWSAITDPSRLARWYGDVEGDLRVGGVFRLRVFASGWGGNRRVEACDLPRRLLLVGKEQDEPDELVTEVTLTPDGDQTILVLEERGMPLEYLAGYGPGFRFRSRIWPPTSAGASGATPTRGWTSCSRPTRRWIIKAWRPEPGSPGCKTAPPKSSP
jgi:uncharacterized protein YndB with AHSA1/START domain